MKPKAKPRPRLTMTLICDRLWGRKTCDWFCKRWPEYRGRTLEFSSDRSVEIPPVMFAWLTLNGYL